jgi:hypothetical protein
MKDTYFCSSNFRQLGPEEDSVLLTQEGFFHRQYTIFCRLLTDGSL